MQSRRVVVAVCALVASGLASADAQAQEHPAPTLKLVTTVTGPAGGTARVHVPSEVTAVGGTATASAGGFAGVGLATADGAHWLMLNSGVTTAPCTFGSPCETKDSPSLTGSDVNRNLQLVLAPGDYTVGLIGKPGSTVSARIAFDHAPKGRSTIRTTGRRTVQVVSIGSSLPSTSAEQPESNGSATLPAAQGMTFVGATIRWDTLGFAETTYDICVDTVTSVTTLPYGCGGSDAQSGSGSVLGESCVSTAPCVPGADAHPAAFSTSFGSLVDEPFGPGVSAHTSTTAAESRITATAYELTL